MVKFYGYSCAVIDLVIYAIPIPSSKYVLFSGTKKKEEEPVAKWLSM
jgi:hypothetical protein